MRERESELCIAAVVDLGLANREGEPENLAN